MAPHTVHVDAGVTEESQGTFIAAEPDETCYDPETRAALNQFAEDKCPTGALVQSLRYFPPRPIARPHLLSREDRLTDRYLWTVYAIEMRRERSRKAWAYFPPCLACATMTGSWCDHCDQSLCTQCEREEVRCPGCIPWRGAREHALAAQIARQNLEAAHVLEQRARAEGTGAGSKAPPGTPPPTYTEAAFPGQN